jgi:hypothetical protein
LIFNDDENHGKLVCNTLNEMKESWINNNNLKFLNPINSFDESWDIESKILVRLCSSDVKFEAILSFWNSPECWIWSWC